MDEEVLNEIEQQRSNICRNFNGLIINIENIREFIDEGTWEDLEILTMDLEEKLNEIFHDLLGVKDIWHISSW